MDHKKHMLQLIEYTKKHSQSIPYAASVVNKEGECLAQAIANDKGAPVLHAEIVAILAVSSQYTNVKWHELTLYCTGEPGAMTAAAACWSNLNTVVYGSDIPFIKTLWGEGFEGDLRAKDVIKTFPKQPALIESVCQSECNQLFLDYQKQFAEFWNKLRWPLKDVVNVE